MAIDFSPGNAWSPTNQNATNPDAVANVTPSKTQWWIKTDPDGTWLSAPTNNATLGRQPGYIPVSVAEVVLADVRTIKAVLDPSGQPISEVGPYGDMNKDQESAFKTAQANAAAPGG